MPKASLIIFLLLALSSANFCNAQPPRIIDRPECIIYIPADIDTHQKCPLVVALSPYADAHSMINLWQDIADKYKWIILASKKSHNGLDMETVISHLSAALENAFLEFPIIDTSRVIAAGFSGGGMVAHALSFYRPNLISAVVVNTGMMHSRFREMQNNYPRKKFAIFIASPTDFRYNEMKQDRIFLEGLGWKTRWIEFAGGHRIAPGPAYQEAAQWLAEQLR